MMLFYCKCYAYTCMHIYVSTMNDVYTCTIIVLALSRHLESRYVHVLYILLVDILLHTYMWAVPGRNRTLFHCVFRPCYQVRSAVVQNFR